MKDNIHAVLNHITAGTHTEADLIALRRVQLVSSQGNVQIGKYNVQIVEGQDVHIGDTVCPGSDAMAIQTVLRAMVAAPEGP